MNRQKVRTTAMNPGPFLTLILSSGKAKAEDGGWRVVSSDTATLPGTALRETEDTDELQSDRLAIVNLEPMISRTRCPHRRSAWWRSFTLLTLLCRHSCSAIALTDRGLTPPRGCVRVVRYASR
jgi:hypothetical protein